MMEDPVDEVQQLVDQYGTVDEAETMSRGRVIKARFPGEPPHVQWFWIATGGCEPCVFYRPTNGAEPPHCLHPKITEDDFHRYFLLNTCPAYKAGADASMLRLGQFEKRRYWVMQAANLCPGTPPEKVEVLQDEAWSPEVSAQAHAQEAHYHHAARQADSGNDDSAYDAGLAEPGPVKVPLHRPL